MSRLKIWMFLGILFATFWVIPNANASLFPTAYILNVDYCTTGCLFGGTGGTVTLSQVGSTPGEVQIVADLTTATNTSLDFHDTVAFDSFTFNIDGTPTISVSGLPSGYALTSPSAGSIHQDGAGYFEYGVDCSGCATLNKITFDVSAAGLTTDSFHVLSHKGSPSAFFSAVVFAVPLGQGCTGVIGADGNGAPTNGGSNSGNGDCGSPVVPEPGTLLLLGSGLVGLGSLGWRRIRQG